MNRRRAVSYSDNVLFSGVPLEAVHESRSKAVEVTLDFNEVIFEEGDPPDYFYLLQSGSVRITKALPDGRQELLAVVEAGEFFGDLALYDNSPRSARATAAVPTALYRLSKEDFDKLRKAAPLEIETRLAEAAISRVRVTNSRLVNGLAATGRLAELGSNLTELAHQLRSPYATIDGAVRLLTDELKKDSLDKAELERWVTAIERSKTRGLTFIDDLLGRLRGESGGDDLITVQTSEILQELREATFGYLMNPAVRYSDENCTYTGEITVDRSELITALADIVKNSVEALPAEGGDVSVNVALEGVSVVFSVSDTGSGISPENLPRVFERDFTHGKNGGTGIGLSHARDVAERHGGKIYIESEPGMGTTVRIKIPKQQPAL